MARVFVTGLGVVSPLGLNLEQSWNKLVQGASGIGCEDSFDMTSWPSKASARVPSEFFVNYSEEMRSLPRFIPFALKAVEECLFDANFFVQSSVKSSRGKLKTSLDLFVGSGIGALNPIEVFALMKAIEDSDFLKSRLFQNTIERKRIVNHPSTLGAILAGIYELHGDVTSIQTACASSAQALGQAYMRIKHGKIKRALVVGADSLSAPLHRSGFDLIGALSRNSQSLAEASRPFDKRRNGFVPGEGAAALFLESEESFKNSEGNSYAEIVGYGETLSAFRITDLPPDGRGVFEAMQQALSQGNVSAHALDYINAHGTSTEVNDRIELLAIKRLYEEGNPSAWVGSTKSMTGHLISGAGAFEALICAKSLAMGVIPPSINMQNIESGYEEIRIPKQAIYSETYRYALSNSIGFGGSNASLLFKKIDSSEFA